MDEGSTQCSSNSPTKRGSGSAFLTPNMLRATRPLLLGNATFLTPDEGDAEATMSGDPKTPYRDFSTLSPADFGITPESFTPQQKGDSKSLIKKFRRRSTIGARGSPENNSLIQYIAHQKRKKMENPSLQASPFQHHSVLREKIAAFQSSFNPLEETEERVNQTNNTWTPTQCIVEEFSAASQQSCKKVRFGEEEILEGVNPKKPPFSPLPKGERPSGVRGGASLRSVLKKPAALIEDSSSREGSEASETFQDMETCGPLQIESNTGPVNEMEEDDVPSMLPLHGGAVQSSPPESRNYSTIKPLKQPLPQPDFNDEDALPPLPRTTVPITEHAVNSDRKETNGSPDFQTTCCRITRLSRKRKHFTETEREKQPKRAPTKKVPKSNKVGKGNSRKTPTSKYRGFGKKRKKKGQKALYGPRETVSRKPLLSPIPEMKEDLSFVSYQNAPSEISILEYVAETSSQENSIVDSSALNLNMVLKKEDAPSVSSALQDAVRIGGKKLDPPENLSPAKLRSISPNPKGQESGCSSNETEKELEFLSGTLTGDIDRGEMGLTGSSASELGSETELSVNFKRFPRRSRRLSQCLLNPDGDEPQTPGNGTFSSRHPLEELLLSPQTVNNLGNLQESIEESFKSVPNNRKRVRRSTRRLKDGENSGLAWINLPADNTTSEAILDRSRKAQTAPSGLELQEMPVMEEQENDPVVVIPCRTRGRRRKSVSALGLEEKENTLCPPERNRRASLGYRSDQSYRNDPELRKLFVNPPF